MIGTTPLHIFTLPLDASMYKEIKITYKQDDKILLEKKLKDCELQGNEIHVRLTQEESFLFECKKLVKIQLRALTHTGEAIRSDPYLVETGECLDREVLE